MNLFKTYTRLRFMSFFCLVFFGNFTSNTLSQPAILPGTPSPASPFAVNESELQEMFNYLSTLKPEELEELERVGRDMLTQMGINPDTLEPLPAVPVVEPVAESAAAGVTPPPTELPAPTFSLFTKEQVQTILERLIERLSRLRQKASAEAIPGSKFAAVGQELDQLIMYLHIINKKRHHERLLETDFTPLIKALQQLADTLDVYEPLFIIDSFIAQTPLDNPYDLLNLPATASQAEIEKSFSELRETRSPERVKTRLQALGITGPDLEQAIKEARLTFSIIADAYDALKDPKSKFQVDRELQEQLRHHKEADQGSQKALHYIHEALQRAFTEAQLLNLLEQFLKKHEPEELALKKEMEAAEAARLKEQAAAAKMRPQISPGGPYEQSSRGGSMSDFAPSYYPAPSLSMPHTPSSQTIKPASRPTTPETTATPQSEPVKSFTGAKKDAAVKKDQEAAKSKDPSKSEPKKPKPSKKKEEPFDITAQQIAQMDNLLFTFDQALSNDLLENISDATANKDLSGALMAAGQASNLEGLKNALNGLYDRLKGITDNRKKKQYGTLWHGISERHNPAKKKIVQLHETLTKKAERAERQIKKAPVDSIEERTAALQQLKNFTGSVEKIGNTLAQIQELFPDDSIKK